MTTVNDGSATGFMVQNLQEFSSYSISIAAVNGSGSSPAATEMAITASLGKFPVTVTLIVMKCQHICVSLPQLPVVLLSL